MLLQDDPEHIRCPWSGHTQQGGTWSSQMWPWSGQSGQEKTWSGQHIDRWVPGQSQSFQEGHHQARSGQTCTWSGFTWQIERDQVNLAWPVLDTFADVRLWPIWEAYSNGHTSRLYRGSMPYGGCTLVRGRKETRPRGLRRSVEQEIDTLTATIGERDPKFKLR